MEIPERLGRYRVTGEVGRGGMGLVLRGEDPALERPVAIKIIAGAAAGGTIPVEERVARFMREARLAARITHPGVVTVYDAGREGDLLFTVMELVDGESLAQCMQRGRYPSWQESLRIAAEVAEALSAAHALGVVHRDIKPANVLLTRDGRVKVTDFGVAKAVDEDTDLTRSGMAIGSPAYMAPEQVRGEALDGRADQFSLGVMLYELLLLRRPFPAETVTTLIFQILTHDPLADQQIIDSLGVRAAEVLRKCLAKDPAERYPDAVTLARAIREVGGPPPQAAAAPTVAELESIPTRRIGRASAGPDRRPFLRAAAVGGGILALAVVAALLAGRGPLHQSGEADLSEPGDPAAGRVPGANNQEPVVMGEEPQRTAPVSTTVPIRTLAPTPVPVPTPIPTPLPTPPPTPAPTPTPPIVEEYLCRERVEFHVSPDKATVTINGVTIGIADDWDGVGGGKPFVFPGPGVYYAYFTLDRYESAWVKITVSPDAPDALAKVRTKLKRLPRESRRSAEP